MVEGFKNTYVGIIPNDWDAPCIKEFTDILSGGTPSTKMPEYWGGEIRWMNSGELNLKRVYEVEGRITEIGLKNSATKLIPAKCVLVGLAGQGKTRGTVAINYISLCTNQSIAAILPTKEFDEDYLFHNLDLRYKELRSLSTGDGGRGGLNLTLLRNLPIPTPPTKDEQTAIATALNDADALIQKLQQLIAKKHNIKTGAMQELLKPKEGWEEKKLGDEIDFQGGSQPPLSTFISSEREGYIRLLQIRDYKTDDYKTYIPVSLSKRFCNKNDIMIGRYGPPVFQILRGLEGSYNVALMKAVPSKNVNNAYAYYFLKQDSLFSFIETLSKRTAGQSGIDMKELKAYPFYMPPYHEQKRIAQILSDMDNEIQELEMQLEKYKMLKQGMMQSLLTGKIRLV